VSHPTNDDRTDRDPVSPEMTDPARPAERPRPTGRRHLVAVPALAAAGLDDEEGSLVAEYGLLAVVAAVVSGVLISWARDGALTGFFSALLDHARGIVGA
jgi:Flp pilus assembly pilin Flp